MAVAVLVFPAPTAGTRWRLRTVPRDHLFDRWVPERLAARLRCRGLAFNPLPNLCHPLMQTQFNCLVCRVEADPRLAQPGRIKIGLAWLAPTPVLFFGSGPAQVPDQRN